MPNMNLLKSKMIASGDENFVQCLANILNCSRTTASGKLSERIDFSQSDIILLTEKYHLTADDVKNIFIGMTDQDDVRIYESS